MAELMDGKAVARRVEAQITVAILESRALIGRSPTLGVVLVGDRPDSTKYVELKQKAAARCGIVARDIRLSSSTDTDSVIAAVVNLDKDGGVDGILVQLPLPTHIDTPQVLAAISASKDVDGFHPENLGSLARLGEVYRRRYRSKDPALSLSTRRRRRRRRQQPPHEGLTGRAVASPKSPSSPPKTSSIDDDDDDDDNDDGDDDAYPPLDIGVGLGLNAPCTALGCVELLDSYEVDLRGKHVVVVGRSNLVGLPLALLALHRDATLTVCHVRTPQGDRDSDETEEGQSAEREESSATRLSTACKLADVLIVAAGCPGLIKGHWLKRGAVVLDVGFNVVAAGNAADTENGDGDGSNHNAKVRICGDVCFDSARKVASLITPVPGGIGPMTVAMLMRNTYFSFLRRHQS